MRGAKHRLPVEVFWRDANQQFDVKDLRELPADYVVRTLGYMLDREGHFLVIAQETLPNDDGWRGVSMIPWDIVLAVKSIATGETLYPEG